MATIKRFEDLDCWKEARLFVCSVYRLTKKDGFKRDFDLISQIRRSAVSSMANIAEGFHRSSSKDFLKFLDYSRSSIAETISHAYVALDQSYINENELVELNESGNTVWKKINGMISYLKRYQQTNSTK
ncbi:four helix bundle protein [uncultured Desulfosarcina sp.]|uniref:four helix bundle protein n=1 Tax=uncultured Desulfosarcina sp. TaxID=218289 RepID=UPI0029C766D2|nr:four helix bundle protein [uncultured Desulfosarcina sp.]